jgi:predicted Zn-dependent peptidase
VSDLAVLDQRPEPGPPRSYDFPDFERSHLPNGLEVIRAHVPGRPLLQAQLVVRGDSGGGATSEAVDLAGVTVLTARAMSEGTARRDAVAFVEAAERLGASLGATAGWDSMAVHVEVPRARLAPALALLAEMALQPSLPAREVERLREERLNDLKQTMADARRRVERLFPGVIYAEGAPYARLLGGSESTVAALDREALAARHAEQLRPSASTLIVCGDLDGVPVDDIVAEAFLGWTSDGAEAAAQSAPDRPAPGRRVVLVDRPGAPQSEIRIGHVGTARRIDDYHALVVMNALLGGLFNSRLNRLLREERGYTYGVQCDFDMRRGAGPFAVRCAVETEATAPAIADIVAELSRIREAEVADEELVAARDYLVGVFPLRFEGSAQVAAALAGLVIHGLPADELDRYRPTVSAVSAEAVLEAARSHLDPARASIAVVGDVARFEAPLRDAGYGEFEVIRDEGFGDGGRG